MDDKLANTLVNASNSMLLLGNIPVHCIHEHTPQYNQQTFQTHHCLRQVQHTSAGKRHLHCNSHSTTTFYSIKTGTASLQQPLSKSPTSVSASSALKVAQTRKLLSRANFLSQQPNYLYHLFWGLSRMCIYVKSSNS